MHVLGLNLGATDLWLLAIAGTLATWLVLHRLSTERDERNRHVVACREFRAAILQSLSGLYPTPSQWPRDLFAIGHVLRENFPAMQIAYVEFRHHLPLVRRWRFDRAWRLYRLGKDGRDIDMQCYDQYEPHQGASMLGERMLMHDTTLTYKRCFRKRVEHLLSFAKEA